MIDDIFDFVGEYIIMPFVVFLIGIFVIGIFCIPSCIKQEKQKEEAVKTCFMQEQKTKECEYIIWKYEQKQKTIGGNRTTVVPRPVVIR